MKVLVDTSVWVGHFRQRDEQPVALLRLDAIAAELGRAWRPGLAS